MYFSIGFTLGIILFSIGTLFIIVKPLNIWFYKKLGLDINKDTHYDLIDIAHDSHFSEENKLGNRFGLKIAYSYSKKLNHSLTFESILGQGTTFNITIIPDLNSVETNLI